jgi:protoporphyrinogen oxidase
VENPKTVAVIGGGFTGLVAAYRLARTGVNVTLFERGPSLGGLAGDFELQGTHIEKTYHHIFRTDRDILDLVDELGLASKLIWCNSSLGIFRDGKIYPFMSPLDVLRFKPCNFFNRLRLGAVVFYLQKRKNWRGLASQSAFNWMRRACGEQAMRVIWEPLLRGKFDRYFDSVSMAWLWARIHIRANSRVSAEAEKLGYFRGGFAIITQKLEIELLKIGVKILKNSSVEELAESGKRIKLKIGGQWREFDRCIFTGPSPVLAQLLPAARADLETYRQKLKSIDYLGAVCLVFASEQDIGNFYWLNINEPGAPFLVFINHTKMVDRGLYQDKFVYYIGLYQSHNSPLFNLADEKIISLWLDYLKKIHPQFDARQIIEKHLFKLKHAQHIVDTSYEAKIPDYRTPLPGLFLANFSQIYPEDRGTNYAVREGNKIAEIVIQSFKDQISP